MTVRTGSFDPTRSRYMPAAGGTGAGWQQVLLLAAGLIVAGHTVYLLSGWWSLPHADAALAAPAPEGAQVTFVAQAAGTVVADAVMHSSPAGGVTIGQLPKGTPVTVGGWVDVPAGLWSRNVLWVQLDPSVATDTPARFGFVSAESISVSTGTPRRLSLRGVPTEALLQPLAGVLYGSDASVAGKTARTDATGAGVPVPGAVSAPASAPADFNIPWLPATIDAWRNEILAVAKRHGVDPALVAIIMLVESGGNPRAQSPSGAVGLMQVMPSTGAGIAQERRIAGYMPDQLWTPETNIDFGAYYVAQQLTAFGSADDPDWQRSVELAASAYNGGPGSVQRLLAGGALPNESSRYRQWVGGMWRERHEADSTTYQTWSQAGGSVLVAAAEQTLARQ